MKTRIYLIFLAAALFFNPRVVTASGTYKDYRFFSKAMNREMVCRVYLPEEYQENNPDKRFPVIYFLHGASLGYDSYDLIFPILDNLITFKLIKPVILVLPDGLAPPYNGSFYTNSALYGNFEDFISDDLITFMDSTFYTRSERGQRAIMGASMGGYGALKMAFKHPEKYIGVAGHSGPVNTTMLDIFIPSLIAEDGGSTPFHWSPGPGKSLTNLTFSMAGAFSPNLNNQYQVDFPLDSLARPIPSVMDRWNKENISELSKSFSPSINLAITFDCGNADEYFLYFQNRSLSDTLTKYNIPFNYEEYYGNHSSGLPIRVALSFAYFDYLFQYTHAGYDLNPENLTWEVFPNPASNTLNIRNNQIGSVLPDQRIVLADSFGRIVLTHTYTENSKSIDISGIPAGIYLMQIACGRINQTGKIIIIH